MPRCPYCGRKLTVRLGGEGARCVRCEPEGLAELVSAAARPDEPARTVALQTLSGTDDPRVMDEVLDALLSRSASAASPRLAAVAVPIVVAAVVGMMLALSSHVEGAFVAAVAGAAIAVRLVRARAGTIGTGRAYAAGRIIGAWQHPTAVGALAQACFEPEAAETVRARLLDLLPKVTPADAARQTPRGLAALTRLLYPFPNSTNPAADWPIVAGAAKVLGMTAFEPAIHALQRAQQQFAWAIPMPSEVVAVVAEAEKSLRTNIERAQDRQNLLRAGGSMDPDTSSLLRPASQGEEPQEQLLRPAKEDER